MIVGINSARNAKAHQIETAKTVFARHRITVGQHVAYLTRADSSLKIKLTCKRLGRKLFLRHPVEHLVSVYEDGMSTGGALIRNAVFIEQRGEILNLVDAGLKHVELGVLIQALCDSVEIAAVQSAIGDIALEGNAIEFGSLIPVVATGGDEATHIDDCILLARHSSGINILIHLPHYFLDRLVGITFLTGFDEVGILGKAG